MPLLDFWRSNPTTIAGLTVQQIVANAGDGDLRDGSFCCTELRTYLAETPIETLALYVEQCLGQAFNKGGAVLQDLVNELGRRLDYDVENGRCSGVVGQIGFDGLWKSTDQPSMIVEVKTTDADRLSLDVLAGHRKRLIEAERSDSASSILIVVGRQDTGELEAQIRGSRHAWDVRLISAEALLRLVRVKENAGTADTDRKIRGLLRPTEYTRLDALVDVVFSATRDVETGPLLAPDTVVPVNTTTAVRTGREATDAKSSYDFTPAADLQAKRAAVMMAWSRRRGSPFVRKSQALFWTTDHEERVVCSLSKRYILPPGRPYWYAFHPAWRDFLEQGKDGHLLLAGMDAGSALAVPCGLIAELLPSLNTTFRPEGKTYWHLHILEDAQGALSLYVPGRDPLDLSSYAFEV